MTPQRSTSASASAAPMHTHGIAVVSEMRAAEIEAVTAEEFQSRGAAGNGEIDRERAVIFAVAGETRRVDRDLVGQRPQGRQDAGAAHDDAGIGLADHLEGGALL